MYRILKSLSGFIKQSAAYVIFNLLEKIIPFVTLPIIIRKVSVEGYGDYSFFITIETVLIPILSLNLSNMIYREYYKNKNDLGKYVSSLFWGYCILAIISIVPFFLIFSFLETKLGYNNILVASLFITSLSFCFANILTMIFRLQQNVLNYGIWQIFRSLIIFSFLLLTVYYSPSFQNLVYSRVFALLTILLVTIAILAKMKMLPWSFDKLLFKQMLSSSLPTVLYSLSSFIFSFSDRFVIKQLLGSEALGLYSGIYQLSAVLSILVVAFNVAWMPWLFEKLSINTKVAKQEVVKVSYYLMIAFFAVGILWCALFPYIANIMLTADYEPYYTMGCLLIFSFVFHGIYCIVSPYTYYVGKTRINAYVGIGTAIANVCLNIVLVPIMGIWGSAISLLLTWFLQAVLFFVISIKIYNMPWFKK